MAGHANLLTKGANTRTATAAWTAPATDLRVMVTALGQLGHDVAALIAAAGLTDTNLDDPEARVSCEAYGALIAGAQQRRFTPNLALELARRTPLGAYPLLDYLVVTCDTVGAGIRQLPRYFRITSSPLLFDIDEGSDPVEVRVTGSSPFAVEYLVSLMASHLREETNGRFTPSTVVFRHEPDDAAAMARALGCPVRTKQSWDGVSISRDCWSLPLRRRDPVLRRVLESHANDILSRLPPRAGLALEVQRALTTRIASGDTRIETVARQLAMSPRSLQRRLAAEDVSYHRLVEEMRKEAAGRYVAGTAISLAEIAYLLGYSEPAPFHRAFKRWYGLTPDAFRQRSTGRP
jgi:AraC-like DNA-binding protein